MSKDQGLVTLLSRRRKALSQLLLLADPDAHPRAEVDQPIVRTLRNLDTGLRGVAFQADHPRDEPRAGAVAPLHQEDIGSQERDMGEAVHLLSQPMVLTNIPQDTRRG